MTDSGIGLRRDNSLTVVKQQQQPAVQQNGRLPSRHLKRPTVRNSLAGAGIPTGDISFASVYSAHGGSGTSTASTCSSSSSTSCSSHEMDSLFSFDFFVGISHILLITFCGLVAYVFGSTSHVAQFGDIDEIARRTNNMDFRSLLFLIGLVISQGEALVVYRVHRHEMKFIANSLHLLLHVAGLTFAILLMVAMIQHENPDGLVYFASFQSWLSVILIACFFIQSLFIAVDIIFPRHTRHLKRNFSPAHIIFGISIFIISVLQIFTGMQQYTGVLGECYNKFACKQGLGTVLNISLLCLIGYCITITALVTNAQWARKPTLDEKEKL